MDESAKQAVLSLVRTVLIVAGTSLTARGLIAESAVNEIVGALMIIIPAVWGIVDKYRQEHAAKERETVAVQAGVAAAEAKAVDRPPELITPVQAQKIIEIHAP